MTQLEMSITLLVLIMCLVLTVMAVRQLSRLEKQSPLNPTPKEYRHVDEAIDNEAIQLTGYLEKTSSISIIPELTSKRPID